MLVLAVLSLFGAQAADGTEVVCRSLGIDPVRSWTFAARDGTWTVTHQIAGVSRRVVLALPRVEDASFTDRTVRLRARTANGGIDITLSGARGTATLDAYINYELEVNVDASLTPDIDEIDTDGPVGVSCLAP